MNSIEKDLEDYINLKICLLQTSKCLMKCLSEVEIVKYQEKCLLYAKELKKMKKNIKEKHGINCCICE